MGELAPKTLAIQKAEAIALLAARPIIFFYHVMYPFIWLLNGSANAFVRMFGLKPAKEHEEAHSEEELRIILSESYESGKINVDGKVSISHINELLHADIESEEWDTIGGWLFGQNSEWKKDSEWRYKNLTFIIREKEKHRIRKVEIIRQEESAADKDDSIL